MTATTTDVPARERPSWWRRNLVALVAVALLVPATAVVIGAQEWWDYYQGRPAFAAAVEADGTVRYADATFGPASARFLSPAELRELDAPEGAAVVRVAIPVTAPQALSCSTPTLRETATDRQWSSAIPELPWTSSAEDATFCPEDRTGTYRIVVPYLVPMDAEGPFTVELHAAESLPGFVRLTVDP